MLKHGRLVWWPDCVNIGHNRMLIDPNAAPLDEVWRFIKTIVSIYLTKYKAWAYEREDMEELEAMCYTAAYCRLLRVVRTGQYRKDLSFYLNCRSAVFATCYNTYNVWLRDIRERMNLVDGTSPCCEVDRNPATLFDLRASEKVPRLRTDSEYKPSAISWREVKKPGAAMLSLYNQSEDEYSRYVEDCVELGVKPVDKVTFVCRSYTDEEQGMLHEYKPYKRYPSQAKWLEKTKNDPAWKERRRQYNKTYYEKKKKKKVD